MRSLSRRRLMARPLRNGVPFCGDNTVRFFLRLTVASKTSPGLSWCFNRSSMMGWPWEDKSIWTPKWATWKPTRNGGQWKGGSWPTKIRPYHVLGKNHYSMVNSVAKPKTAVLWNSYPMMFLVRVFEWSCSKNSSYRKAKLAEATVHGCLTAQIWSKKMLFLFAVFSAFQLALLPVFCDLLLALGLITYFLQLKLRYAVHQNRKGFYWRNDTERRSNLLSKPTESCWIGCGFFASRTMEIYKFMFNAIQSMSTGRPHGA